MGDGTGDSCSDRLGTIFPDILDGRHAGTVVRESPLSARPVLNIPRCRKIISHSVRPYYGSGDPSQSSYQTNWLSTSSERPNFPFVTDHHSPSVRVGETSSRDLSRSSGFLRELRNAWRARLLKRVVKLVWSASEGVDHTGVTSGLPNNRTIEEIVKKIEKIDKST